MSHHPPSFPVARLFRKTSKEGRSYFVGRLGGARLALLKNNETADDGGEIWHLMISEAQSKSKAPPEGANPVADPEAAKRDWQPPASPDADIPF